MAAALTSEANILSSNSDENNPETKAFMLFSKMCWEQHHYMHPEANIDKNNFREISTGRWQAMNPEQKAAFYYKLVDEEQKLKKGKRQAKINTPAEPISKKASVEEKAEILQVAKDPNKPKKARSSYMFFNGEMSLKVRAANSGMTMGEVSREVSNRWKNLNDKDRQPYLNMASSDKDRYGNEMKNYVPPPPQPQAQSAKKLKDPNKPKACRNAYVFFNMEMTVKIRAESPTITIGEIWKEVSNRWKNLDEKDRQPYVDLAASDKDRFDNEMKNYVPPPPQLQIKQTTKKLKDPNKPKRYMSAFMFFSVETHAQTRKDNPQMALPQIAKETGNKWKELDEEKRKKYEEMMQQDKQRHEKEMELYNQGKFVNVKKGKNEAIEDETIEDEEGLD